MKVQNKGGKGNPNHDDATGQFTEENGGSAKQEESLDQDVGAFELDFDVNNIDDFLESIDFLSRREKDEQADLFMSNLGDLSQYNALNSSFEDKLNSIKNSSFGYDEAKIAEMTDKEIESLFAAECIINGSAQFEQMKALAEDEKEKIKNESKYALKQAALKEFQNHRGPILEGIWLSSVSPENFDSLNSPDEFGSSRIDRKKEYFNDTIAQADEIINDPLSFIQDINDAEEAKAVAIEKLNKINKWIEDVGKYNQLKEAIQLQFVDKIEQAESKIAELNKKQEFFHSNDYLRQVELSKEYTEKFQDKNAAYSQFRKDNAIWFKGYEEATKYFGPIFENMWKKMSLEEKTQLVDYTGNGFSKYNRPLRGLTHPGWSGFNFAEAVTNMTNAIEKCEWDSDIWVQRGIHDSPMFVLPGSKQAVELSSLTKDELQSLVGTSFKDNGFYSAGAGKGTGMYDKAIIFNTYCPKGTKMAYMNTKGTYAGGIENEMIIQRGYSYRITKVEKKGGHYYIDCEVVLGSNNDMIRDMQKLTEIGNKYLK